MLTSGNQAFKKPPFRIDEKGWGEFDMSIVLTLKDKQGEHTIAHDLNFQSGERYDSTQTLVCNRGCAKSSSVLIGMAMQIFKNPKPELVSLLQEAGLATEENGTKGKREEAPRKRNRKDKMVRRPLLTLIHSQLCSRVVSIRWIWRSSETDSRSLGKTTYYKWFR